MLDANELKKLLKEKREHLPSEEYFEDFLQGFHHRQRADSMQIPAWKLGLERLSGLLSQFEVPPYAYASAFGVFLLLAAVVGVVPMGTDVQPPTAGLAEIAERSSLAENTHEPLRRPSSKLLLDGRLVSATFEADLLDDSKEGALAHGSSLPTRYVLDTRPISHASPFSF